MKAWAIKEWNKRFENAASRKLKRPEYLPLPLDQGSLHFRRHMKTTQGAAAFGHYMAAVEFAGTLPVRGLFYRSGRALTVEEIAGFIGIPCRLLEASWKVLSDAAHGAWVYQAEFDPLTLVDGAFLGVATHAMTPRESAIDPPLIRRSSPAVLDAQHGTAHTHAPGARAEGTNGEAVPGPGDFAPSLGEYELSRLFPEHLVGGIVAAYPKRASRVLALKAADRALVAISKRGEADPIAWLLGRVQAYAAAVKGHPQRWVKLAHNWFEAGCYDDDPATWAREDGDGKPAPKPAIPTEILDKRRRARQWLRVGENDRNAILEYRLSHQNVDLEDMQLRESPAFQEWVADSMMGAKQ